MGTEHLCPAAPSTGKREETRLTRFFNRVFSAAASTSSRRGCQQQLLLPCLLGDPFVCLNVDRRVGIAAGTLLGRLSLFYFPPPSAAAPFGLQHHQHDEGPITGQVLLPQAYSDDGVAMCWTDTTYLTAVIGAADVSYSAAACVAAAEAAVVRGCVDRRARHTLEVEAGSGQEDLRLKAEACVCVCGCS